MKGYVYVLKCSDGSYYTGSTKDLERRLWQHKNGNGAKYTKTRLPVKLVYSEEYERIDEAFYREKQIKGWSRKKKEALIAGRFDRLSDLAKNHTDMRNNVASTGSATNASSGSATNAPAASTGSAAGNDTDIEPVRNEVVSTGSTTV